MNFRLVTILLVSLVTYVICFSQSNRSAVTEDFNKKLNLFYIACGEQDQRIEYTKKAVADMRAAGLEVIFNSFPGDHEWQVWRKSLHDFASRVFK